MGGACFVPAAASCADPRSIPAFAVGFEEMTVSKDNPLEKLASIDTPLDLTKAATGICDLGSIASSISRGKTLADSKAGGPVQPMDKEKYGAIVLYTGNAIYRALNEALRIKHTAVPRYLPCGSMSRAHACTWHVHRAAATVYFYACLLGVRVRAGTSSSSLLRRTACPRSLPSSGVASPPTSTTSTSPAR